MVVNGSTDRTESVVRGYQKRNHQVRLAVEPRKVGKGQAVIMGFDEARGDLIGFTDADGATPPHAFQELVDGLPSVVQPTAEIFRLSLNKLPLRLEWYL